MGKRKRLCIVSSDLEETVEENVVDNERYETQGDQSDSEECRFTNGQGYGIAGAAWATMVSQVVAGFMMVEALKDKGYNGYVVAAPSANELVQIFKLAAPVFIMMMSKAPCMKIEDGERG
ncbi:protein DETOXIFICATION 46, chloroplastic-like isoform X2 [Bidens hawaiensis]|uniref:protein DETOXIFICATION 46, chloroplastic-like isoform X2 n=1 Tax=Bidens hawaiensis TaxID=980011 RepID=UPI0040496C5E